MKKVKKKISRIDGDNVIEVKWKTINSFIVYGITISEAKKICQEHSLQFKGIGKCCDWCEDPGHLGSLTHILLFFKKTTCLVM
jgi:hypothetical protein